jgi:hypothetical protein
MNLLITKTMNAADIRAFFKRHPIVRIRFRKTNGDERTMIATTDLQLIPLEAHPFGGGTTHNYRDSYPVYDLHKQAWRAFKPSNLLEMESLDNITVSTSGSLSRY